MERAPLILAVHDGRPSRVHYALTLAATAAAVSQPVTIFVAGEAVACFRADWQETSFDQTCREAGIATFRELRQTLMDFKVEVLVCEQALRLMHVRLEDLDPLLDAHVAGSMTLLQIAQPPATCLFI